MGLLKRCMFTSVVCIFCLTVSIESTFAASAIPSRIKVGITYGSTDKASMEIKGTDEIDFGRYTEDEFNEIKRFDGINTITVSKDTTWHIRIGNKRFEKEDQGMGLDDWGNSAQETYTIYDQGYQIATGDYLTEHEATIEMSLLESKYPDEKLSIEPPSSTRIKVLKNQKIIWIYNANEAEYGFEESYSKKGCLKVNNISYRGGIIIKRFPNSDLTVINTLTMDEYLYGVLPKEMAKGWPLEALKAQAVAARNYATISVGKHKTQGFDICSTAHCQVYGGYSVEGPISNQAVDDTSGKLLMHNGKVVQAFFHSNSGGKTESSENVWKDPIPYLVGVDDQYSIGAPNTNWSKMYTKTEIEQKLRENKKDVGQLLDISIKGRSPNERVLKLFIKGSQGTATLEKEEIRKVFGYNDVKSTWFDITGASGKIESASIKGVQKDGVGEVLTSASVISANGVVQEKEITTVMVKTATGLNTLEYGKRIQNGDTIQFSGHGWGHGLGLSQWGAKKMAETGMSYKEILEHYYKGVYLE